MNKLRVKKHFTETSRPRVWKLRLIGKAVCLICVTPHTPRKSDLPFKRTEEKDLENPDLKNREFHPATIYAYFEERYLCDDGRIINPGKGKHKLAVPHIEECKNSKRYYLNASIQPGKEHDYLITSHGKKMPLTEREKDTIVALDTDKNQIWPLQERPRLEAIPEHHP